MVAGGEAGKFSCFMPCFGVLREGPITCPMAHPSAPTSRTVASPVPLDRHACAVAFGTLTATTKAKATVKLVDPTAEPIEPFTLAARSPSGELLGRIALLSIAKRGSDVVLDRIEQLLKVHHFSISPLAILLFLLRPPHRFPPPCRRDFPRLRSNEYQS